MHEQKESLAFGGRPAIRDELNEIGVSQRSQADAKLTLHFPYALAGHHFLAKAIVAVQCAHARLTGWVERQPTAAELLDAGRQLEIVLQQRLQRGDAARALRKETAVVQENKIVDASQRPLASVVCTCVAD